MKKDTDSARTDDIAAHLEAKGTLRPPAAVLPRDWLQKRPTVGASVVDALLEERGSAGELLG